MVSHGGEGLQNGGGAQVIALGIEIFLLKRKKVARASCQGGRVRLEGAKIGPGAKFFTGTWRDNGVVHWRRFGSKGGVAAVKKKKFRGGSRKKDSE